ncbi:MAG: polysaccharide biosynthesis C-terminal domain-containing protein, partial [Candidatus Aenigmarchaeota archaeon]|nr:polysaccharide biosynthesis C-terminal domain-containing protein [Candidatus Aenigmarchaeota archaeon]MDW8159906.1 polysaccharide biosynthesis C-terminal domain-containing protein [Candidatus Aenigmarchaeota archaeon]
CSILGSVIYGYQNMRLYMLTNFFGFLVKISLTTILLYLNFSYFGPIIGFIISYAVILFLRLFSIKIGRGESIENEKVLINFAIPAFISSLSIYVFSNSHYVFLSIFRTTLETGIFSIAMIISNIIAAFPNILAAALFPIISYLSADRRNTRKQSYLIEIVLRYASLLSLPVSIFLVVFSKEIIILFSSEKFLKSADLIPILVTASILFGLGNIFFHSLYAIGKTKIYRNLLSISSTLYILLTVLLTPKLSYIGISLSYLVSSSFLFVSSYYYIKKFLKVRLPLVDLFKISLACMIIFIPFYFFTKFFDNLLQEILFGIFSGVLYFFVLMPLRFYKKSDINILAFLEERASFGKFVFKITRKIIERSLKINGKLSVKKSR